MVNLKKIQAVYFSPTDTTRKVVFTLAERVAKEMGLPLECHDFTLPEGRTEVLRFEATDLVIFGTPVYAGRVPNVLLKFLATIEGNDAWAVPIVVFGNRHYDDALIELRDILEKGALHTIAAAAFIGEHSFSKILAKGRPDEEDLNTINAFALKVVERCQTPITPQEPIPVEGVPYPYRGYYTPQDRKGCPVDIRKVKPLTNEKCNDCKICANVCPMGAISHDDVRAFTGICIKCGACIKKCPVQAKYYDDAGYLYHQHELEEGFTRRALPETFFS